MKSLCLVLVTLAMFAACSKNPDPNPVPPTPPNPPVPPIETTFQIDGAKISIKGVMKPGAKATLAEVKASILTAVKQLESK